MYILVKYLYNGSSHSVDSNSAVLAIVRFRFHFNSSYSAAIPRNNAILKCEKMLKMCDLVWFCHKICQLSSKQCVFTYCGPHYARTPVYCIIMYACIYLIVYKELESLFETIHEMIILKDSRWVPLQNNTRLTQLISYWLPSRSLWKTRSNKHLHARFPETRKTCFALVQQQTFICTGLPQCTTYLVWLISRVSLVLFWRGTHLQCRHTVIVYLK